MQDASQLARAPHDVNASRPAGAAVPPHRLLDRGAAGVFLLVAVMFFAPAAAWVELAAPGADLGGRPLAIELRVLVLGALLSLLLALVQIVAHARVVGGPMIRGNRDDFPRLTGFAARIPRAHQNLLESFVPFAAVVLGGHAMGMVSTRVTIAASVVFLSPRLVHAVSYAAGIVVLRSAAFYAGLVATVVLAAASPLFG